MTRTCLALRGVALAACFLAVSAAQPPKESEDEFFDRMKTLHDRVERLVGRGELEEAEVTQRQLIADLTGKLGANSAEVGRQKLRLAWKVLRDLGKLHAALEAAEEGVAALRQAEREKSRHVELENLPEGLLIQGTLYDILHRDDQIAPCLDEALRLLQERKLGRSELAAQVLKARGLLVGGAIGDHRLARSYLEQALGIAEAVGSPPQFRAAILHSVAATWVKEASELEEAGATQQAKAAWAAADRALQKGRGLVLMFAPTPAQLVARMGIEMEIYARKSIPLKKGTPAARQLADEMGRWLTNNQGRMHQDHRVLAYNNYASTLYAANRPEDAEQALAEAFAHMRSKTFSNEDIRTMVEQSRALLWTLALNRVQDAYPLIDAVLERSHQRLRYELPAFAHGHQVRLHLFRQLTLYIYLDIATRARRPAREVYERIYRWKGLLFECNSAAAVPPAQRVQWRRLQTQVDDARRASAHAQRRVLAEPEAAALLAYEKQAADELAVARGRLEEFLRQGRTPLAPTDLDVFLKALPHDVVFVDFCGVPDLVQHERLQELNPLSGMGVRYVAFVLRGGTNEVVRVDLRETRATDKLIEQWREQLGGADSPARTERLGVLGRQLAQAIWQPLQAHCAGAKLVWLCPDGSLWRCPFAALPGQDTAYLIQQVPVAYAVSARHACQLLASPAPPPARGEGLLLVDEIPCGPGLRQPEKDPIVEQLAEQFRRTHRDPVTIHLRGNSVLARPLALALQETGANVVFVGHGVMSRTRSAADLTRSSALYAPAHGDPMRLPDPLDLQVPLAGAGIDRDGRALDTNPPDSVMTLDLPVQNAPLRARRFAALTCSWNLAPTLEGEGLMGFSRAVLLGGYRTLLAAQWPVSDKPTFTEIAGPYFQYVWESEGGDALALQAVQKQAIGRGVPQSDPKYWAAWAVIGDPGSLAPLQPPTVEVSTPTGGTTERASSWGIALTVGGAAGVLLVAVVALWLARRP